MKKDTLIDIFKKASLARHFETKVFDLVKNGIIKIPVYLSAGEEYIPATLSTIWKGDSPQIFAQHRAHSTYLAFGGSIEQLIDELLEKSTGCARGMGGSASIQSKEINMYGHDGMLGSQVPIAVGACHANKKPTLAILGDASAEEDYVLAAMGYAATKKLPILFVVSDNNLCVLTEKKIRRSWSITDVAKGFGIEAFECEDCPEEIEKQYNKFSKYPGLLNVNTNRLFWHAGAGIDPEIKKDQYQMQKKLLGDIAIAIDLKIKTEVEELWKKQLEIQ